LDNQLISQHFDEIENRIEQLLGAYEALKLENDALRQKIERLEEELQGATEAVKQNSEGKDLIRKRIDDLLARLGEPAEAVFVD
jgi:uncharacterized coiled-coil DUF342 family protein